MICTGGIVLKLLLNDARFLALLHPWSLGPSTAAGFRCWSGTCHTLGPAGSAQSVSYNLKGAKNQQPVAALMSVRHHSSCSSSSGSSSSRKMQQQQQQQAQLRRQQPYREALQQRRQQSELDCWPEVLTKQDDKQIFRCGVVTPVKDTPLWRATFYGNVPSQWWPQDSSSNRDATPQPAASSPSSTANGSSSSSSCELLRSSDDCDLVRFAADGDPVLGGGHSPQNSSSSIPSWDALLTSSNSTISSVFRLSDHPRPQPYWRHGELCHGRKPTALVQPSPAAQFNRAARALLLHQLRPLYPCSVGSTRVAFAERRARLLRRRQQQMARQELQQQQNHTFQQLLKLSNRQLQQKVAGARPVSSDWRLEQHLHVQGTSCPHLLFRHQPSKSLLCVRIQPNEGQKMHLLRRLELLHRRLTAKRQAQHRQQQFRLRSHSYVAAAAAVLSEETYLGKKQLPLQQPALVQQFEQPRQGSELHMEVLPSWALSDESPTVGVMSTKVEAEQFLTTCGTVARCIARRDEYGVILPMPRHCIPGYCSTCGSDSIGSSSSSSTGSQQQQPEDDAILAQQQWQRRLQRQARQSVCVAGVGCDAIVQRGRKRIQHARRQYGWWAADHDKFKQSPGTGEADANAAAGARSPFTAAATTAGVMSTPTSPANLLQQQQYRSGPIRSSCGANGNFVVFEECEVDSEDDDEWDDGNEGDSDYVSDSDCDDELDQDQDSSPEASCTEEEPYVYRNNAGVIYGFWFKCPMG